MGSAAPSVALRTTLSHPAWSASGNLGNSLFRGRLDGLPDRFRDGFDDYLVAAPLVYVRLPNDVVRESAEVDRFLVRSRLHGQSGLATRACLGYGAGCHSLFGGAKSCRGLS